MSQKILVLFAHPDDEILFMGGTLLKYRDKMKIDFACLTVPFNKARLKGLFRLGDYFDTGSIMCLGYEDDPAVWREGAELKFDDTWVDCLDFSKYDAVFSHNQYGEYYHPHHIYIHETLKRREISFYSFGHLGQYDCVVELSPGEISDKQKVLKELYPSEFSRCIHKFSYWRTDLERFRFEGQKQGNIYF
jgi:hypothetical protein